MPGRRVENAVAGVFGTPAGDLAKLADIDLAGAGVAQPEKGTALGGLIAPADLSRIVRDRGAEVGPPLRLAVIAVGAGIGEDVHSPAADLNGQCVGVGVRSDTQEAVRATVTPAPDLRGLSTFRAEQ